MTDRQMPHEAAKLVDAAAGAASAATVGAAWDGVADRLRASGLRWTPQRRTLVDVLRGHQGHVTATELIAQCRDRDRTTTPSTVYRTLDVLEEFGLVAHGHGPDGREEYHVLPDQIHGHLYCSACGATWEIRPETGAAIVDALAADLGFTVDLSHVTISGRCRGCDDPPPADA
jgi:Fur family transcriptional regulator, ferric uptake regulator